MNLCQNSKPERDVESNSQTYGSLLVQVASLLGKVLSGLVTLLTSGAEK